MIAQGRALPPEVLTIEQFDTAFKRAYYWLFPSARTGALERLGYVDSSWRRRARFRRIPRGFGGRVRSRARKSARPGRSEEAERRLEERDAGRRRDVERGDGGPGDAERSVAQLGPRG